MLLSKIKVLDIKNIFNKYKKNIELTHELEIENKINYLDVELKRTNNKISYNSYRKPMFSGRVLQFYSNHPIKQKRAMIYTLIDKTITLSKL